MPKAALFPYNYLEESPEAGIVGDVTHERYTVEYIKREAFLLMTYFKTKRKEPLHTRSDQDLRIMRRWSIA